MEPTLLEKKADVIKAMAHPSRLVVIEALAEGEMCVCDIQTLTGADMSTVSKHLLVMKKQGILAERREGKRIYYRLNTPCILRFLDCIDAVVQGQTDRCSA